MSNSNTTTLVNRQSRLVQPTATSGTTNNNGSSRLSSYISSRAPPSSTFLSTNSSSSSTRTMQITSSPLDSHNVAHYQPQSSIYSNLPNANTSGLPTPQRHQQQQSRLSATTGQYSPTVDDGVQTISAPTPSTVGSALRRRQPSPVVPIKSRLPPPPPSPSSGTGLATNLNNSSNEQNSIHQPTTSFSIRRSQSQRPSTGQANLYRSQATFTAHMRTTGTNSPRSKSQNRQESMEQDDEDDEDLNGGVESLLPLKSTSYIGRLMTTTTTTNKNSIKKDSVQQHQAEPQSEPILAQKSQKSSNLKSTISKPSQLVKPLINGGSSIQNGAINQRKSSTGGNMSKSQENHPRQEQQSIAVDSGGKFSGSTFGLAPVAGGGGQLKPLSKSATTNRTSSFVPAPTKFSSSMLPSMMNKSPSKTGSRPINTEQDRRLSLQPPSYNNSSTNQRKVSTGKTSDTTTNGFSGEDDSESSNEDEDNDDEDGEADEEEEEEEDEEEEDDLGQDEEDDDATTATTMTQMSDSNLINQEFNNMIQMLSSSAILGDSNLNDDSLNSASSTSYENDTKERSRSKVLLENNKKSTSTVASSPIKQSPSMQLPKVKSKVVKSQSLSFNNTNQLNKIRNNENKFINDNSNQLTTALLLANDSKQQIDRGNKRDYGNNNYKQENSSSSGGVKLPPTRPRSRIIFDPTNSQFHVSCTDEDDTSDYSNRYNSRGDNKLTSKHATTTTLAAQTYNNEEDEEIIDESSMKLLDTHNQILSLKYLPNALNNRPPSLDSGHIDEENDTVRRLKDCRGSLESLMVLNPADSISQAQREQEDTITTPYGSLPASSYHVEPPANRKSPVSSALRSIFGLQSSPTRDSVGSINSQKTSNATKNKVATIVRHASLRTDPRCYEDYVFNLDRKNSTKTSETNNSQSRDPSKTPTNLGSDLLHRASKKLSASSSSLTSKFKFISSSSSPSNHSSSPPIISNQEQLDGARCFSETRQPTYYSGGGNSDSTAKLLKSSIQATSQTNSGLPPRMPINGEIKQQGITSSSSSSINSLAINGINKDSRDQRETNNINTPNTIDDFSTANGVVDNDGDTTILSDTSTLNGDLNNLGYKCAEFERTINSLKNKLIGKEKELTDMQLKQWSSDYLIDQLKSTIGRLEKENAQLKAVLENVNRAHL